MDDIVAHFMPIVDLSTNQVVGYEALARRLRNGKAEPPGSWLDEILVDQEKSRALGARMFREALKRLKMLPDDIYIAVNLEVADLRLGAFENVRNAADFDTLVRRLVIEISERNAVTADAIEAAAFARQLGARIALDDIGAGSARLMALIDLEPAFFKLDASITRRLPDPRVAKLVRFLSAGAKVLGAHIVCEGVESQDLALLARNSGVACGQGYHFGKPGPLLDQELT